MAVAREEHLLDLVANSITQAAPNKTVLSIHLERTVDRRDHRHNYYRASLVDRATGSVRSARFLAKFHGADRARSAHEAASMLWNAGFRPPSRLRVARPLGYSAVLGASFQELSPGAKWLDHLADDDETIQSVSARAAEWLAALHKLVPRVRAATDDGPSVVALASSLADRVITPALIDLAFELQTELRRARDPLVASHGDFHPKNVLFDGTSLSIIDLDKLAEREASFDAGDAIGQLLIMSYYARASTDRGIVAAKAFWRRYARLTGASPVRTTMHVRRALIQALAFKVALGGRANSSVPGLERWLSLIVTSSDALEPDEIIDESAALAT